MSSPVNTSPKGCKNQSRSNGIEKASVDKVVVEYITTETGFDTLHEDWIGLHASCETASLFNSWYWTRLWWQHYGDMGKLFIVVVRVNDVVQGIAPFYRCKTRAVKLRYVPTLRFLGSGGDTSPDDLGLLFGCGFENTVSNAVCDSVFNDSHCTRLQLTDIDENSELLNTLLLSIKEKHWGKPIQRQQHRHVSTLPETVDAFEKSLSKNARKQRRRRRSKLYESDNGNKFMLCKTHADIDIAYVDLLRLHRLRHAKKGGSDSFQTERYNNFHLAAMKHALDQKELRLTRLIIDGKTIGVEYAFLCKGVLSFFQTGFDPAFKHFSPGHLLMMETIDRAIEDGAKRLDLLKGDYAYKQTYAKQNKTTIDLDLWQNRALARLVQLIHVVKKKISKA